MNVDVSVIIVSWNVCDLLRDCLRSLRAAQGSLSVEIIVVDGASHDGSPAMVAAEFPEVRLIAHDENVGFPRGNNIGLAAATGRYLFLLNPDTTVEPDTIATLHAYLENNPVVGLAGAQLRYPDGTVQSSRRRFPTVWTGLFESTWLEQLAPRRLLDDYYMRDTADEALTEVDWLMGACLFTRRAVWTQVGGMDEGYFMYSEELDWCRRNQGRRLAHRLSAIHFHRSLRGQKQRAGGHGAPHQFPAGQAALLSQVPRSRRRRFHPRRAAAQLCLAAGSGGGQGRRGAPARTAPPADRCLLAGLEVRAATGRLLR